MNTPTIRGLLQRAVVALCCCLTALPLVGCGEDEPAGRSSALPYKDNETVLISPTVGAVVSETPDGDACVQIEGGACIKPQDKCGEGARGRAARR